MIAQRFIVVHSKPHYKLDADKNIVPIVNSKPLPEQPDFNLNLPSWKAPTMHQAIVFCMSAAEARDEILGL
jgi:hypothetical protein